MLAIRAAFLSSVDIGGFTGQGDLREPTNRRQVVPALVGFLTFQYDEKIIRSFATKSERVLESG
jgi:hypothetical protein